MRVASRARLARTFHALSDPTRLALVDRLRNGERCVCELMDVLGAAQSRLSFHLRVLKDAGVVRDRREGRWIYYRLDAERLEELADCLEDMAPRYASLPVVDRGECCT